VTLYASQHVVFSYRDLDRNIDRYVVKNMRPSGFEVRATMPDGKEVGVDVAGLTLPSLRVWLRQDGGVNLFAETVFAMSLGHDANLIMKAWADS
jgi:hypothetical protein